MDATHLIGAEQVQAAGRNIVMAAESARERLQPLSRKV